MSGLHCSSLLTILIHCLTLTPGSLLRLAAGEKQNDSSPWSSSHLWSSSRRDGEMKSELGLSGLGEGRVRSGLASSMCRFKLFWGGGTLGPCSSHIKPHQVALCFADQPERVTSTYAQGARPKETTFSPYYSSSSSSSSSSSAVRDGPLSRHSSSSSSSASQRPLLGVRSSLGSRSTSHYLNVSSTSRPSEPRAAAGLSTSDSSSRTPRFAAEAPPPTAQSPPAPARPAPNGEEPGSYRTCRRLLSRLFSRQSSQDSSSGSSSLDGGDGGAQTSLPGRSYSGAAQPTSSASSWLPSAPPGHRSPHLLPRRPTRDQDSRSSASPAGAGGEEGGGAGGGRSQQLRRRWAYLQHSEDQEDQEGAVGFRSYADGCPRKPEEKEEEEDEEPPELRTADGFTARRRAAPIENSSSSSSEKAADEEKEPAGSGSDQERLRKIKERYWTGFTGGSGKQNITH